MADWLWGGNPNPTVDTSTTATQQYPAWLQQQINQLIGRSSQIAGENYIPYPSPRTQGFSQDQTNAFQSVRNNQGDWSPYINAASGRLAGIGGSPGVSAASPYIGDAFSGPTPLQAAQPYINEANAPAGLQAAGGYLASGATSSGGLGAAAPWLQAGSATLPGSIGDYMSPYTGAVTDRIAQLGARNLSENLLPTVNDTFTKAGQFGSSRNADFTARALRDTNESVLGQQAQALESGYSTAGNLFNADANRMAGLAGTVGSLGEAGAGRLLSGGSTLGSLAESGANRTAQLGSLAGQLTGDEQSRYLQAASTMGNLAGSDAATQINAANASANLGTTAQNAGLRDSAALEAVGQEQQAQGQKGLDLAYQDFLQQRDYPKTQANFMSSIIRGLPYNTTTSSTTSGPATTSQLAPSPLAQLTGAGLGLYGLTQAFKKRGGAVHKPHPTHYLRRGIGAMAAA